MQILIEYAIQFIEYIGRFFSWVFTAPQSELDYVLVIFIAIGVAGLLYSIIRNLKKIALLFICIIIVFFVFRSLAII